MKAPNLARPCRLLLPSTTRLCAAGLALLLALAAAPVPGQPAQPSVSLQKTADGSNLLFQLPTQPSWFYTFQQSTDLTIGVMPRTILPIPIP